MPKVIKIVVSDKFFEEHIAGTVETLVTQNVPLPEAMARMVIGVNFKNTEEIELNTDNVTDENEVKLFCRSIIGCLSIKIMQEHGKEN